MAVSVEGSSSVPALYRRPPGARAIYVMAPASGSGMTHPLLETLSDGLFRAGIATFRFEFPYMQRLSRHLDSSSVLHATVRGAVEAAKLLEPDVPMFAGGRSFGGRIVAETYSKRPLPGIDGLAFVGYPLHPPNSPSLARGKRLAKMKLPMLFVQGTEDMVAREGLMDELVDACSPWATLRKIDGADHTFRTEAGTGPHSPLVLDMVTAHLVNWLSSEMARKALLTAPAGSVSMAALTAGAASTGETATNGALDRTAPSA